MTIDEIMVDIESLDDSATVEELRGKIVTYKEKLESVKDDVIGYEETIKKQTDDIDNLRAEVDRLKEENGRLFRERVTDKVTNTIEKVDAAIDDAEAIDVLKANIIL